MSQDIETIVSEFLQRRTTVPRIELSQHLFRTGVVNSLFVLELLTFLESRFEVEIGMNDLDLEAFSTIERIAGFVRGKQARAGVGAAR